MLALLLAVPVLVISYAAMRLNLPMADGALMRMDALIGFHWPDFVRLVDRSPRVATLLQYAYSSFAFQLLLLPILLCLFGFQTRAYRFILAFLLLCAAAAAISLFFPSLGAYVAYGIDRSSLRHVDAHFGYFYLESFAAVRGQADFVLGANNAAGIITFPSVHAGVAVLCAWAAWPSRVLRYPLLVLNILMFVSAISHGAHYLVDVLAGAALAGLAIALATGRVRIGLAPSPGGRPRLAGSAGRRPAEAESRSPPLPAAGDLDRPARCRKVAALDPARS